MYEIPFVPCINHVVIHKNKYTLDEEEIVKDKSK